MAVVALLLFLHLQSSSVGGGDDVCDANGKRPFNWPFQLSLPGD